MKNCITKEKQTLHSLPAFLIVLGKGVAFCVENNRLSLGLMWTSMSKKNRFANVLSTRGKWTVCSSCVPVHIWTICALGAFSVQFATRKAARGCCPLWGSWCGWTVGHRVDREEHSAKVAWVIYSSNGIPWPMGKCASFGGLAWVPSEEQRHI